MVAACSGIMSPGETLRQRQPLTGIVAEDHIIGAVEYRQRSSDCHPKNPILLSEARLRQRRRPHKLPDRNFVIQAQSAE